MAQTERIDSRASAALHYQASTLQVATVDSVVYSGWATLSEPRAGVVDTRSRAIEDCEVETGKVPHVAPLRAVFHMACQSKVRQR